MIPKILIPLFLWCWLASPAQSQDLPAWLQDQVEKRFSPDQIVQLPLCTPDSTLSYTFDSPVDSTLSSRTIFYKYGNETVTTRIYQIDPPALTGIDSTIYDALARPVFRDIWEYDDWDESLYFEGRTIYFPRGTTMLNDSLIEYEGLSPEEAEPYSKIVNAYGPDDQILEEVLYYWNGEFYPGTRTVYIYDEEGKIGEVQTFGWYIPQGYWMQTASTVYTYDSNDSLITMVETDVTNGKLVSQTLFTYDFEESSVHEYYYSWNEETGQWELFSFLATFYDEFKRPVMVEGLFFIFAIRLEIAYIGETNCFFYDKIFLSEDFETWELASAAYYYPNYINATYGPPEYNWEIFPNPATGEVQVLFPEGDLGFSRFSLVNLLGQTDLQGEFRHPATGIDVSSVTPGTYFLVLYGRNKIETKKIVVGRN